MKNTKLSAVRFWLLAIVLFGGALALHPSVSLAAFDFPSLRVGLYQVAAAALVLSSLTLIGQRFKSLIKNRQLLVGVFLLIITFVVGVFSSLTILRSTIYTLALVVLLAVGLSAGLTYHGLSKSQRHKLLKVGLFSGLVLGILSIGQLLITSFESSAFGTLCTGCVANVFGFPRINLFAAEPQFLASSLLPAFFVAMFYRQDKRLANWSILLSSIAIALTFSRGAFLAIAGALLSYLLIAGISRVRRIIKPVFISAIGIFIGFAMLIASSAIRYNDTPHIIHNTAVSMIDQLSLGIIKIPQKSVEPSEKTVNQEPNQSADEFQPSGFVAASSDDRLDAANLALLAWMKSPQTVLFGVGLGSLGSFINQELEVPVPVDQTVYIFYILLLSSVGIVGIIPLVWILVLTIWRGVKKIDKHTGQIGFTLAMAFTIHFWFFGSLINSVHIFAWIGLLLYNYPRSYAKKH